MGKAKTSVIELENAPKDQPIPKEATDDVADVPAPDEEVVYDVITPDASYGPYPTYTIINIVTPDGQSGQYGVPHRNIMTFELVKNVLDKKNNEFNDEWQPRYKKVKTNDPRTLPRSEQRNLSDEMKEKWGLEKVV
jgi:hypothetical protein